MDIGVIGAGRIGSVHAGNLVELSGVDHVHVHDTESGRARHLADSIGATAHDDLDELFAAADAVVIASSTDTHAPLLLAAVRHGLPTFCEKPIALELFTTDQVVAVVESAGVPVQMGFQRRFDAGYRRAHDLVAEGSLGRLYLMRVCTHDDRPPPDDYIPRSGGIFKDTHIHDFDVVRFVTGMEVEEVYADGSVLVAPIFEEHGDVDTAAVLLKLVGGTICVATAVRHHPRGHDVRLELVGSEEAVAVGWSERSPVLPLDAEDELDGPAYANFLDRFGPAYRAELEAFVDVAAGRRPSPCTVFDAREALRIAIACDRSRAARRPVRVEEVR